MRPRALPARLRRLGRARAGRVGRRSCLVGRRSRRLHLGHRRPRRLQPLRRVRRAARRDHGRRRLRARAVVLRPLGDRWVPYPFQNNLRYLEPELARRLRPGVSSMHPAASPAWTSRPGWWPRSAGGIAETSCARTTARSGRRRSREMAPRGSPSASASSIRAGRCAISRSGTRRPGLGPEQRRSAFRAGAARARSTAGSPSGSARRSSTDARSSPSTPGAREVATAGRPARALRRAGLDDAARPAGGEPAPVPRRACGQRPGTLRHNGI